MSHHPLLMTMGNQSSQTIITSNLVLWLDGSSDSYPGSGTTWYDLSGQGNNVTFVNMPTFSSSNGGYFDFDGTDDYGNSGTTGFPTGSAAFTMQIWFMIDAAPSGFAGAFTYGTGATGQARGIVINSGLTIYGSGFAASVLSTSAASTATWYNVAFTYDGTNSDLFINGAFDNTAVRSLNTAITYSRVGQFLDSAGEYWNGKIAQVLIYNVELSSTDIDYNYDVTAARFA